MENLSLRTKIAIGVGLVLLGLLGLYGIYYFFLRPAPPVAVEVPTEVSPTPKPTLPGLPAARPGVPGIPITTPGITPTPREEPITIAPPPAAPVSPIATGGLTVVTPLTSEPTSAPARAGNGRDINYYNRDDGKFYRITPDGKANPLSDDAFRDVESIAWAPGGSKAVLEFPDGSNILYDFTGKKQTTIPKHWTEFSFAPAGDAIAFKTAESDPASRWLAIANPDGTGARAIEPMGTNQDKVTVSWSPNQAMIATFIESRDGLRQEVLFIGKNQENFKLAVVEGRQFLGQWTPKGDRMLYSAAGQEHDYKPSLWIVDAAPGTSGENRKPLNLETWADKCTIASDNTTAYCAVPKELPRGAGIVRDIALETPDNFWRVDLNTGSRTFLATPAGDDVTATNLIVSEDGQNLFFTDTKTGKLVKMQLK